MPIGLKYPIRLGQNGYFEQTNTTLDQIKANLETLLKTNKGERRFQPDFGIGVDEFLFNQQVEGFDLIIKKRVQEVIKQYFKEIIITNINIELSTIEKNNLNDIYRIYINVTFLFNNQEDVVNVILDRNKL